MRPTALAKCCITFLFLLQDCKVINIEEIHCPAPPLDTGNNPTSNIIRSRRRRRAAMDTIAKVIHRLQTDQQLLEHSIPGSSLSSRLGLLQRSQRSVPTLDLENTQPLDERLLRVKRVEPISVVQLGFIMDGVLSVRNLSAVDGLDATLKYYPNPRVYNFSEPDSVKVFKGEMLIIEVWTCFKSCCHCCPVDVFLRQWSSAVVRMI